MAKDLTVSRLCDAYGALLTEHQLEILRSYYDDDLSLAEIAENHGITRQAALCSIKRAETLLRDYESKIGLMAKSDRLARDLELLRSQLDANVSDAKVTVGRILNDIS